MYCIGGAGWHLQEETHAIPSEGGYIFSKGLP